MDKFKAVYEKFINLAIAAEKVSDLHYLDPIEKRVLNILSTHWSNGKSITVGESVNTIDELSSATAFKYIKKLKNKGYIQLVIDKTDNRVKYVLPTSLTDELFSNLGKYLVEAVSIKK